MGWLFAALVVSITMAVSSVSDRAAAITTDGARLRVVTFNIHKGADRRGQYDLRRTIDAIASFDADLVGVQEALRNDPAFNCDDQPALIAAGLTRATGRPWSYAYSKAWITENRECLRRDRGDDVATEGLALFAPGRIVGSTSLRLSEGRIGLMARLASMPGVPVVLTHLSANRQQQPDRVRELATLLPWAERRRAAILMGDLNATPDAQELVPVLARFRDAWADAAGRGLTGGVATGATRPGRRGARIDYVFYMQGAGLSVQAVDVIDTAAGSDRVEVSDHRPVVVTFRRTSNGEP
jgi:endonuclease/exonuclease/phosphatase family metal-dependent hydrolase